MNQDFEIHKTDCISRSRKSITFALFLTIIFSMFLNVNVHAQESIEPLLLENPEAKIFTPNTVPVYRFWSDQYKSHFYTMSAYERNDVISRYDDDVWLYEGIAFYGFKDDASNRSAVNRYWSDSVEAHFYSSSQSELVALNIDTSWTFESIEWYLYDQPELYSAALHRFYSKEYERHFYTVSESEKEHVMATDPHWDYEGITAYVPI